VADPSLISQEAIEAAADDSTTAISQEVIEAGADSAITAISQEVIEAGADSAVMFVSQLCIEYSIGPLINPTPPVQTLRFDTGLRASWWLALQLSDSGIELRDKVVKAARVTGKMTQPSYQIYGYGPGQPIDVAAIEEGVGSRTKVRNLPSTTLVRRGARHQINVPNCRLHTIRVAGIWDGSDGNMKDQVHEIVYEVARQGVRR